MERNPSINSPSRRNFLTTTTGVLAAAMVAPGNMSAAEITAGGLQSENPLPASKAKKIPIGVFDPAFPDLSLDEFIDKISAMGLEAVEMGTGGYPNNKHCPMQDLLNDDSKLKAWRKKFDDKNIKIATLSCHGNPVHPDKSIADRDIATFKSTVLLAEKLGVKVIVGFSGCPGGTPTDSQPNWITYRWPPEYAQMQDWQWKERVIPYWQGAAKFAREHGVHRLALEMHPNFVVYNPLTLLKLREAVGPEIGANCDLSHLFWQGCDPVTVIRMLGREKCLFHAHMKDTCFCKDNVDRFGVLNFVFEKEDLPNASETFRAVGYGHPANTWKEILKAYMEVDFDGIFSIENEDPILSGEVGVERAAYVLKNVRDEILKAAKG
jgi:sugar phosphate isomerase/epimerase